jgi:hypothetical protein
MAALDELFPSGPAGNAFFMVFRIGTILSLSNIAHSSSLYRAFPSKSLFILPTRIPKFY